MQLLDVFMPSRCAICNRSGSDLCADCIESIPFRVLPFERFGLSGFSITRYTPEISKLLVSYKDQGQFSLAKHISKSMLPLLDELPKVAESIYLVPAPCSSQNLQRRGFQPALLIARELSSNSKNFRVLNCLVFRSLVVDQVGLGARQRFSNLAQSISLNQPVAGKSCVIIDDVVTTGATLLEASKALFAGNAAVLKLLTFAQSADFEREKLG